MICDLSEIQCPACGEPLDPAMAVEVYLGPDGERRMDWRGCCYGLSDLVAWLGPEGALGYSWEELFAIATGDPAPSRVDVEDGLAAWRLETFFSFDGSPGIAQAETFKLIDKHHAHHSRPQGWKFGVACYNGDVLVGVASVGRPVSRILAKRGYLEVTRVCTFGDRRLRHNAASKLLGACARRARQLGAVYLCSYTLEEEEGVSYKAAGWSVVATTKGGSWDRSKRRRQDKAPTGPKTRWELTL